MENNTHNSHDVAKALIDHFREVLRPCEVLQTVKGERHGKKKIVTRNIDIGRNYVYGIGFVGLRRKKN